MHLVHIKNNLFQIEQKTVAFTNYGDTILLRNGFYIFRQIVKGHYHHEISLYRIQGFQTDTKELKICLDRDNNFTPFKSQVDDWLLEISLKLSKLLPDT